MTQPLGSEPHPGPAPGSSGCLVLGLVGAALVLGFLVVVPNFLEAKPSGKLTACKSNLKNMATALEMYRSDHGGVFPPARELLVQGNYLKTLPTCPAAHKVSYDYRVGADLQGFTLCCQGRHHYAAYGQRSQAVDCTDYPAFDSKEGLLEPVFTRKPDPSTP